MEIGVVKTAVWLLIFNCMFANTDKGLSLDSDACNMEMHVIIILEKV